MPDDRHSSSAPLPESLRRQLEEFRRQLWRSKIAEAIFAGIFGLLFSYLLVFGLDRLWPTPAIVRLIILLGGTSLAAVFAPIWLHRWVWGHRHDNQLARLIARKHPGLGDRLLGVVELQKQLENEDSLSPRLRAAAMEAVAAEAEKRKLNDSLPASRHRRWSLAVIALFLIAGTALVIVPKAGLNSLKRWLFPLSSTARYTFTLLEDVPFQLPVPQGEAFSIDLRLSEDSEWQPEIGEAQYGRQDPVWAKLDDGHYRFEFPGQQDPGEVRIQIGDARHEITVIPSLRPSISSTVAEINYPDYLELENRIIDVPTGVVTVVEGSQVQLTIEASRALASAEFGPLSAATSLLTPAPSARQDSGETPAFDPEAASMDISDSRASTGFLKVTSGSTNVPMSWRDDLGLTGNEGFTIRIDALKDEAPTTYLQGVQTQKVMLPEETIDLEVIAEDDYGLKEYGLVWEGQFTRPTDEVPAKGELRLEEGQPSMNRAAMPAAFSPLTYEISPQKLTLRAYAEDYLPGRGRVYSQPIIIHVLSRDEHAQMLKNQFDRAISELEDMARRERNLLEENQRIERLDGEELQSEEGRQRLAEQEEAERQQVERMENLAEKMEELLKNSSRNGTIDKETLKKMAETAQAMRELGEQDMPKVEDKLDEAQDQKNTEEKSEQDVEKAVEQQQQNLEKMQETIEKANDANQRFEASTFVNRLKKAAGEEEAIAMTALAGSRNFGLHSRELDPADLRLLNEAVRQQSDTASDVHWIQEDLGHFFTRSNKQEFREILDEMITSEIDLGLEDIRLSLIKNHSYIAADQAKNWSAKLLEWAKKLEGSEDSPAGGGGGGGGGGGEDEDFDFMLRVMRLIQQEQDLRARTRALETLRRSFEAETP
ncbi:hypothetical protein ACFQY0_16525 [Haloferula chungangensis]|uniref:DUF4175 family protein n=1 Tax=Haloferula chungangensis TaxID=1048331 RepID=A0ABW2LBP0_9BACT